MSWFMKGALAGIIASPALAAFCALIFRFPVPFAGYMNGPAAVMPALLGSLFYGLALGGFVVQGVLAGLAGMAGARRGWPDERRMLRLCLAFSVMGSSAGVITMAVLDWIIGPW